MQMEMLQTIIVIAMLDDMELHHVDVKSAFLNAALDEDIYMMQPPEYDDKTGRVARLIKAIYGLKQAS